MPTPKMFFDAALGYSGDNCLVWPFARSAGGYGKFSVRHQHWREAHRVMCERMHGPQPTPKHEAAHTCGNRLCINPRHIHWATHAENLADRLVHGTHTNRGENHYMSKLSNKQADEIRISKDLLRVTAQQYGVTISTISSIRLGKHRRHLS